MKYLTLLPVAAVAALSTLGGTAHAAPSHTPVYTVTAIDKGLARDAAHWNHRIVLVRGVIRAVSVGDLPADAPAIVLTDGNPADSALFAYQKPASHQRINFGGPAIYRVRLTSTVWHRHIVGVATIL